MLPETEPGTMTNLVDRYIARQTHFSVAKDGTAVTGRLADRDGTPVVGAKITISAIEGRAATPVSVRTRMGSVPAGATRALFVLRVNEECDCSATADVAIGTMEYEAGYGGPPVRRRFPETAEKSADRAAVRFTVTTGQAIGLNTAPFPVAPNDPFTIHVPMGATASSSASGYVALIFIKDGGREAGRIRFPFEPATRPIGTAVTDATGRFAFLPPPDVLRSGPSYRVDFAGDDSHRLSSASLP
jgi:hypothetical protein